MFLLTSCSSIEINNSALHDFITYQINKEIISFSRSIVKDEFEQDFSMSYDLYQKRLSQIRNYRSRNIRLKMIKFDSFFIDNRGHLRFLINSVEKDNKNSFSEHKDLVDLDIGINGNKIKAKLTIDNFSLRSSLNSDLETDLMFMYRIRF